MKLLKKFVDHLFLNPINGLFDESFSKKCPEAIPNGVLFWGTSAVLCVLGLWIAASINNAWLGALCLILLINTALIAFFFFCCLENKN